MKKSGLPKDELFFSASDIKALLKKNKKQYIKLCAFALALSFCFNSCKDPRYKSEAKFKKAYDGQDVSSKLKSVLPYFAPSSSQVSAASIMKSRSFLKEVVASLGLQAQVEELGFFSKKGSNFIRNCMAELGKKHVARERFVFRNVVFNERESQKFFLRPSSTSSFEILSHTGHVLAQGKVGQRVVLSCCDFVIDQMPSTATLGRKYPLVFLPVESVVKGLQKTFSVKEDKSDKDVLVLSAVFSNPLLSASFLDYVMKRHVDYVKEESAAVLQDHLDYFEGRKRDLENQYTHFLEEHVAYLKDSLQEDGFMGLRQEVAALEKPSEEYHSKLYEVELELSRLKPLVASRTKDRRSDIKEVDDKKLKKAGKEKIERINDIEPSELLLPEKISANLVEKEHEKESARTSLLAQADLFLRSELSRIALQRKEAKSLLQDIQRGSALSLSPASSRSLSPSVYSMLERVGADEEGRGLIKTTLQDLLFSFDVQEKQLIDRHSDCGSVALELEGLTPENAQQLYLDYNRELDGVYLNIRQLSYLKEQIYDPEIELSSLCNLLTDPVSQQMIQRAAQMALELRDDSNRSVKEHERIKDSLSLQKSFLSHHIMQMIQLQKMRATLIEDKIVSLQKSSVHLLSTEKNLIEERLSALRSKMSGSLPMKWKMENQLQLKKELFIRMIEGIAHLEESKRVDQNILPSSYKVLDAAYLPILAERPGLVLYPSLVSFFSAFCLLALGVFRRARLGSPISIELLRHHEIDCCGSIGRSADAALCELSQKDLETLRKAAHFARRAKESPIGIIVSLCGSYSSNYTKNLAAILSMQGSRVLLIDALFSPFVQEGSEKGLVSFLQDDVDAPNIIKEGLFDRISSGGYARNYLELLFQPRFKDLLEDKKRAYDFVIIHSQAAAGSAEAMFFKSFADVCFVSAGFDDSIENFEHFLVWQQEKNSECLSFVLRET